MTRLNWKPNTTAHVREQRAQMLHDIRAFFYERNVLEVETPALSQAANTDPYIESFEVRGQSASRFLHTSPEYPMKRLLAADSGDIYQISKVWRSNELGSTHNPEFTMLEWYRVGFSYHQLLQEVDVLLTKLLASLFSDFQQSSLIICYQQLFLEKLNINPHTVSHTDLISCCQSYISGLDTNDLNHQDMLDALLTHCIEPKFSTNRLTFIIDYPESQSALATTRENDDGDESYSVAERFEVYLGSLELGNGYQEETSYQRNKNILEKENNLRQQRKLKHMPEDSLFLDAIKAGIPHCSGVAIGLDRVLMGILKKKEIKEVINFSWDNA